MDAVIAMAASLVVDAFPDLIEVIVDLARNADTDSLPGAAQGQGTSREIGLVAEFARDSEDTLAGARINAGPGVQRAVHCTDGYVGSLGDAVDPDEVLHWS